MVKSQGLEYNHTYIIYAPQKGNEEFHGERVTARPIGTNKVLLHFHNAGSGDGDNDVFEHCELVGMEFLTSARKDDDDLYE